MGVPTCHKGAEGAAGLARDAGGKTASDPFSEARPNRRPNAIVDSCFALVYLNHFAPIFDDRRQNCWIFVRRRPAYQDLIDRCDHAFAAHNQGRLPDAELPTS